MLFFFVVVFFVVFLVVLVYNMCIFVSVKKKVKVLFAGERKLCDEVLEGIEKSFLDRCFMEATSSSLATLLSFGEAVVKIKMSPDKLFKLLDVYETMCEFQPEVSYWYRAFLIKFRIYL